MLGPEVRVIVAWLENFDDHASFPLGKLCRKVIFDLVFYVMQVSSNGIDTTILTVCYYIVTYLTEETVRACMYFQSYICKLPTIFFLYTGMLQ